jgi:hypothetical protein
MIEPTKVYTPILGGFQSTSKMSSGEIQSEKDTENVRIPIFTSNSIEKETKTQKELVEQKEMISIDVQSETTVS